MALIVTIPPLQIRSSRLLKPLVSDETLNWDFNVLCTGASCCTVTVHGLVRMSMLDAAIRTSQWLFQLKSFSESLCINVIFLTTPSALTLSLHTTLQCK